MKNNILFLAFLLLIINCKAQNYYFATPQGYGAATTGGGNASPVTVSTYADLKTNMSSTAAKVILVSGQITIPSGQPIDLVVTNKSIIGLPGAKLINENQSNPGAGIFYLKPGSTNVIIRNLVFVGPGAYDIDGQDNMTADGCTNLWVDHCEFQDGQDGNFDIKGLSDNITVSWCKFTYLKPALAGGSGGSNDHRFSDLIGSSATNAPTDGHYNVTFQNCYWASGCKDRMPRARNAELHILNCLYNVNVSGSKAINLGGGTFNTTCYVENTNFANVGTSFATATSDGGTVAINFTNSLNAPANVGTVSAPPYTATVMPVSEVASRLGDTGCGSGATLMVTSAGTISSGVCSSLGVKDTAKKVAISLSPTYVKDKLNFNFSSLNNGLVQLDFFSADGKKVHSYSKQMKSNEDLVLNIEDWASGMYICKATFEEITTSLKFVKI